MPAKVILNPYSARWTAKQRRPEAEAALQAAGIEYELQETDGPEHAESLAQEAALAGYHPIIAAGGDGTISEIINGLLRAKPDGVLGPLGILPLGTANDLVNNLGLPLMLEQAAQAIAHGKTRRIDLGKVNEWVFHNNSAVGLEPVVSIFNMRMVRMRGTLRYLVAALRAINSQPEWKMTMRWDDGEYEGDVSLVSVGNCPVTGGLFKMAPAANPADGLLTFVHGYAPTRLKLLSLLPRTINGSFVNDPAVHQYHTTHLKIETTPPTPLQVDGEVRTMELDSITYQILPDRLDVYTP